MNTKENIADLIIKAESGDPDAQNSLGVAYHNGDGVERNYQKAREWYLKAAKQDQKYALNNLAIIYKYALGVDKDLQEAFKYFLRAAELGQLNAIESVAIAYDYGYGTPTDYKKAVEWYIKAANNGLRVAQNNLGAKYKSGQGVQKSYTKAFHWYSEAAKQGEEFAQCNLAICYEEGNGVQKNLKKALYWFEKSSKNGHERATKRLKSLLETYDSNVDRIVITFQEFATNPFRVLGVYSNASTREITANKSKLTVFAKIGKGLIFPIDKLISNFYTQKYPIQQSLFDEQFEDGRNVATLYKCIQHLTERIDSLKHSEFYTDYDESDSDQLSGHNKVEEDISSIHSEMNNLYRSYENKVKNMFSVERTLDSMDKAIVSINQPLDRIKHALFWFVNVTPIDEIAINNFAQGNYEKAKEILEKGETYSSLVNSAIISLIEEDLNHFVHCITTVIHNFDYRNDFCKEICGDNFTISEDELAHTFIDVLLNELPNEDWKSIFYDNGVSADDDDYVCTLLAKIPSDKLLSKTSEVSAISREKGVDRYNAAMALMELSKNELDCLNTLVETDSLQYQSVADKVARELLNCSIDYYNKCSDTIYLATKQTVVLNQYAFEIAIGTTLKERAEDCLKQVKEKLQKLPPEKAFQLFGKVNALVADFSTKPDLIIHSKKLLSDCAPLITEIKEILGRKNEAYLDLSTKVVANSLINIIAEVNSTFEHVTKALENPKNENLPIRMRTNPVLAFESLKSALKESWQLFVNMDLFDLEDEFKNERYLENRKIIQNHLSEFKINTYEFAPTISMKTETEIFNSCKTIPSLTNYINQFPNGKYRLEAEKQISRLKAEDDKFWNECVKSGNFNLYISKYRYGLHSKQAKVEVDKQNKIKDDNFWAACCKTKDYEAYLSSYKNGLHSKEASSFIEKKKTLKKWLITIAVILAIFIGIAAIWGPDGFIFLTGGIAFLGFCGFAGKGDVDCGTRMVCLAVAAISGLICYALSQIFG